MLCTLAIILNGWWFIKLYCTVLDSHEAELQQYKEILKEYKQEIKGVIYIMMWNKKAWMHPPHHVQHPNIWKMKDYK